MTFTLTHTRVTGDHNEATSLWRSRCSCGWAGAWRPTEDEADALRVSHFLSVLGGAA